MRSKPILFVVEGKSDKVSLEGAVRNIVRENPYFIIQSDVTSDNHICPANIERVLATRLENELWKRRVKLKDFLKVVHLIDTDAAYLSDDKIEENVLNNGTTYMSAKIIVRNKENIVDRNKRKRFNIQMLLDTEKLKGVPYSLYYCSVNLEHAFHNNPNACTVNQKIYLSNKMDDTYGDDPAAFIALLKSPEVCKFATYRDSWRYIQDEKNALERASNLYFAFKPYIIETGGFSDGED